jgi:hypothetical protein
VTPARMLLINELWPLMQHKARIFGFEGPRRVECWGVGVVVVDHEALVVARGSVAGFVVRRYANTCCTIAVFVYCSKWVGLPSFRRHA